ncbi:phosphate acetyltransferase [Agromyces flavus]|uniref:Phosphate acetyltransferase n=1 Tax=Agromyces flavus TaxID=589382 RepID=A0A1H1VB17_9MICO|nr:phosphate acetyltransferase [Agromyces flavus]MCP2365888.1 phosphate acetyltransferase [Agromyces flavus]GGI43579.1 phosphate acetyltransferase [Agromyces flavus]SDS81843.1 phosphate acetyltransferase [Agromyces flavus]
MAHSIYICSAEGNTGKSTVALGAVDTLSRRAIRVGVFRPIARSSEEDDYVLELLLAHDGVIELGYHDAIGVTYEDVHADPEGALATIVRRFKAVESRCDVVVVIGSDYTDVASPTELAFNARIAANLGAPVLLVVGGRVPHGRGASERLGYTDARTPDELAQLTELAVEELTREHATLLGIVANRADPDRLEQVVDAVRSAAGGAPQVASSARPDDGAGAAPAVAVWAIPEDEYLVAPSMRSIMHALGGELYAGDPELLEREALGVVIAAMSMENVLARLIEGSVVIVPGDRSEVLLGVLTANSSATFPSISGIVLNGGFPVSETVERLIEGLKSVLPIIRTQLTTYDAALAITSTRGRLAAESQRKRDTALALFEKHVDGPALLDRLDVATTDVVTPLMFEYGLLARARQVRKHIVLPEGYDDRILRAAATLLARDVADLTILGEEIEIRARAIGLGLDISKATVLSNHDHVLVYRFADEYQRRRAHKGVTLEQARDTVQDVSYFGTMMVELGLADGMVSGAMHTTAHTIRPAFEIIKTRPDVEVVSSVFLMALADRVLVYGDCAIVPDPTAEQLADIAISSAATAAEFGIEPRVAMLSYSTGESGSGADVDKVRRATDLVRERAPELPVEGPIQYDAAADAAVARTKMPGSDVAGRATVFVFPDLNTGNNTYKAVQRSAGAVAIGPVLQGLRKPVNDLSRGALVQDIVNTVAITAIQAAAGDGLQHSAGPLDRLESRTAAS